MLCVCVCVCARARACVLPESETGCRGMSGRECLEDREREREREYFLPAGETECRECREIGREAESVAW